MSRRALNRATLARQLLLERHRTWFARLAKADRRALEEEGARLLEFVASGLADRNVEFAVGA